VFEITNMLLTNKAEISTLHKRSLMMSAMSIERMASVPSPRILNSHLPFNLLPRQLNEKRTKTIVVLRNPKDVAVSWYYQHTGICTYEYDGTFSDFLPLFMEGNRMWHLISRH